MFPNNYREVFGLLRSEDEIVVSDLSTYSQTLCGVIGDLQTFLLKFYKVHFFLLSWTDALKGDGAQINSKLKITVFHKLNALTNFWQFFSHKNWNQISN